MSFSLALDLGASFIKGVRVADDGTVIGEAVRAPSPPGKPLDGVGSRIIPAQELLAAVQTVLSRIDPRSEGRLYAFSNQMHGFVFVDQDLGAAYGPVTWQDQRGHEALGDLRASLGEEGVRRLGNELRTGIPLATLASQRGRFRPGSGLVLASIGDWVAWSLAGGKGPIHATNAAAMGLMDVQAGCWDPQAVELAGLDSEQLPEISGDVVTIGGHSRPCCLTPVGDQQAALLGIGVGRSEMSFNVATGAQVARVADRGDGTEAQVRPFFDQRFLHTVTHIPAGRALNAWLGLLTELSEGDASLEDQWDRVIERSRQRERSDMKFNLALFDSADGLTGSVRNILEDDLTVGEFMGAALARLAESLAFHAGRVGWDGVDTAVYSGGWLREGRLVGESLASQLPVPVRRHPDHEDALAGLRKLIAQHLLEGDPS